MAEILMPFRYCEYKETDVDRDLIDCGTLAGIVIAGMSFCDRHKQMIEKALETDVTLVRAGEAGDGLQLGDDGNPKKVSK